MDIQINTFDGIKLKTAGTFVEEDINLSVSDKAFEEILYDGEVENGTLGANKLASLVDKTITEVTESDLQGATKIGNYAFYSTDLTSVAMPNTITNIGNNAFWGCEGLTEVVIPKSVKVLSAYAFDACSNLATVVFEEESSTTTFLDGVFRQCTKLKTVNLPSSLTTMGSNVFYYCTSLESIKIPKNITSLGTVFESCTALKNVIFEEGIQLTSINSSFKGCSSLTSITIPSTVTSIGSYAFYKTALTEITIPNRVKSIGTYAFSQTGLKEVTIPNSVTSISSYAFLQCYELTSLTIPASVTSLGTSTLVIGNETNKATITFLSTTPPTIASNTFNASYINKIIVPKGYGETYKTATNWSNFADYIVEATE